MKNILERLAQLFTAVSFAEAGEHDTARKIMGQKSSGRKIRRKTTHRGYGVTASLLRS